MRKCLATAGCMSVLFDSRFGIECMPEPFRLQADLLIGVSFPEYCKFVNSLSIDSGVQLITGTQQTVNLRETNVDALYVTFLRNMAFAILKEIHFAECALTEATMLLPVSSSSQGLSFVTYLQRTATLPLFTSELRSLVEPTGYWHENLRMEKNNLLFLLANRLYAIARGSGAWGELNLTVEA